MASWYGWRTAQPRRRGIRQCDRFGAATLQVILTLIEKSFELPGKPGRYLGHVRMMIMQFNLDLIFPIRDAASAELMVLKARCLRSAGIIDLQQKNIVEQRAQQFLAKQESMQEASAACDIDGALSDAVLILRERRARRHAMPSAA